jgi:hypothetical protein
VGSLTDTYYDLHALVNAPGWDLNVPLGLGQGGHIFGVGYHPDGEVRAWLLTPVATSVATAVVGTASR